MKKANIILHFMIFAIDI